MDKQQIIKEAEYYSGHVSFKENSAINDKGQKKIVEWCKQDFIAGAEWILNELNNNLSSESECEQEAALFAEKKLKLIRGLVSEDYEIGYREGIEHYLISKNKIK